MAWELFFVHEIDETGAVWFIMANQPTPPKPSVYIPPQKEGFNSRPY